MGQGRDQNERNDLEHRTLKMDAPMKKNSKLALSGMAAACGLGVLCFTTLLGTVESGWAVDKDKEKDKKHAAVKLEVDNTPIQRDNKSTASYSYVVKKVSPSVVKVYSTTEPKTVTAPRSPFGEDPLLRRFFGDDFGGGGGGGRQYKTPREQGLGSGVIVTKDGYILTNNHVVENADKIKVAVGPEDKEYTAEVVGKDDKTDIAVLKIDANDLTPIATTDSDSIEVGDVVLAIGNPFGIGQTVTMGLVSATGRATLGLFYENFIQTDAPINPGNSGGALVDTSGRLVGINTAILSRSGGNQGIGFAVPVNLARFVLESLVRDGRVVRGYMGVVLQPMSPALAKQFKLPETMGALVAEVADDSAAAKAGLKDGDVILEVDGKTVKDSRTLRLQISQTSPGTKVVLKVLRDGEKRKIDLVLRELPDNLVASRESKATPEKSDALNGVTVEDLTRETRRRFRIPAEVEKGAVVAQIEEDSASAEAGLRVGDVIREINHRPVNSADEAVELSEKIKDDSVLLRVWSRTENGKGSNRYIVVQEEKRK